jgi:hypothetical protein
MYFEKAKALVLTVAGSVAAVSFSMLQAQQPAAPGVSRPAAEKLVEKAAQSARLDLTPESLPTIHSLVRPHDNEWRHLQVQWLTDVVAARKKAAAEDKPIVVIHTGGAGYNEPLGIC